jgi:hypothetical protein
MLKGEILKQWKIAAPNLYRHLGSDTAPASEIHSFMLEWLDGDQDVKNATQRNYWHSLT